MAGSKKAAKKTTTRAAKPVAAKTNAAKTIAITQADIERRHAEAFAAGSLQARADVMTFLTELNDPLLNVTISKLKTQWEAAAMRVVDTGEIRFEVYPDVSGEYRWRAVASNGEVMADSGESFSSRSNANRSMSRLIELVKRS